jgi:hypothetical protein
MVIGYDSAALEAHLGTAGTSVKLVPGSLPPLENQALRPNCGLHAVSIVMRYYHALSGGGPTTLPPPVGRQDRCAKCHDYLLYFGTLTDDTFQVKMPDGKNLYFCRTCMIGMSKAEAMQLNAQPSLRALAKARGLTDYGDFYIAEKLKQLVEAAGYSAVIVDKAIEAEYVAGIKDCIDKGHPVVVAFDVDGNGDPCCVKGLRAHWAVVFGYYTSGASAGSAPSSPKPALRFSSAAIAAARPDPAAAAAAAGGGDHFLATHWHRYLDWTAKDLFTSCHQLTKPTVATIARGTAPTPSSSTDIEGLPTHQHNFQTPMRSLLFEKTHKPKKTDTGAEAKLDPGEVKIDIDLKDKYLVIEPRSP